MSLIERIQPSKVLRSAAEITATGLGLGMLGVMGVTARHHRQLTHRSLEINPLLASVIDYEMRFYSPDPIIWAAVHRLHHDFPDATLYPFWRKARAINWAEANPDQAQGVIIPDSYSHLDPFFDRLPKKDVLTIGHFAEENLKQRLGRAYEPQGALSKEELQRILNPTEPQYHYPKDLSHAGEYSQDEIARILLTDPHSPALIPPPEKNGVRGVLRRNVGLYGRASHLFWNRPDLIPEDLRTDRVADHREGRIRDFIEGSLLAATLVLLVKNRYEPEDFLKAIIAGTAINTVKLGLHIFGGNVTNSLGHAGVMTPDRFRQAIGGKEYKPTLNPDGTVSTDSVNGGLFGRLISMLTLDEVGGQDVHHRAPWQIAYTFKEGWEGWKETPWGKFLSVLADSKFVPFIRPNKGFDLKEGEIRPDMPHPAMDIIHLRRIEQLKV